LYISKKELKQIIENAYRRGMLDGYGVEHQNIEEDENKAWEEYWISIKEQYKL
jgi:predicted Ser/Thr protein kinase